MPYPKCACPTKVFTFVTWQFTLSDRTMTIPVCLAQVGRLDATCHDVIFRVTAVSLRMSLGGPWSGALEDFVWEESL